MAPIELLQRWGRSTVDEAEHLRGHAQLARSNAHKYAADLCRELGIDDPQNHIVMGPTKDLKRILEKAASQCGGRVRDITDICRLTIVCDDPRTLAKARKLFFEGRGRDFHDDMAERSGVTFHTEPKDYISQPKRWGYMAIYLRMQADLGGGRTLPFELQITHRGMYNHAYPQTHKLYESIREEMEIVEAKGGRVPDDLSDHAKDVLSEILDIHRDGAKQYGLLPLVSGAFPQLNKSKPRTDGQEVDILPPAIG